MFHLVLAILFSAQIFADGEWWSIPRTEDEKYFYYVGVSEGKDSVPELQDKAFNKAMGELIREHFGMSIQINENGVEELKSQQYQVVTKQSSAPLFIKGVGIAKTREKDVDNGTRVYVQIQADKKTIADAIKNQISNPGEDSLNTYGVANDKDNSKIDIKVKTHPQGALIHFGHLDRRFSLQGQGDAKFFLPRGRYQMVVSSPGYATVTKEIVLRDQGHEETIILEELNGAVDLQVFPEDAKITFHGNRVQPGLQKIPVGKSQRFKVEHPDYFPQEIEFILEQPETIRKVVNLETRPSVLPVEVYPPNATIFIDDQVVRPYKGKIELEAGKKKMVVTAPGYFSHSESVYVSSNREYPLKVIRLAVDDANTSPTDKKLSYRFELNPFAVVDQVGYGGIGGAFYVEYYYIALGGGINYTSYKKENEPGIPDDEINMSDNYATLRLITPKLERVKFFASGTIGQFSRNRKNGMTKQTVWEHSKNYQGLGGGLRAYITPKWSFQAEYFKINTIDKETKIKEKQDRVIMGFSYEF